MQLSQRSRLIVNDADESKTLGKLATSFYTFANRVELRRELNRDIARFASSCRAPDLSGVRKWSVHRRIENTI